VSRRAAAAIVALLLLGCPADEPMGESQSMKLIAGDVTLDLPSGWEDMSTYSYGTADESLSVRVVHLSTSAAVSNASLLEDARELMDSLGSARETQRAPFTIGQVPAEWVALEVTKEQSAEPDQERTSFVRMLVARPVPERAVMVTLLGNAGQRAQMDGVWNQLLAGLRFSER
jgi:hypothetical protein